MGLTSSKSSLYRRSNRRHSDGEVCLLGTIGVVVSGLVTGTGWSVVVCT